MQTTYDQSIEYIWRRKPKSEDDEEWMETGDSFLWGDDGMMGKKGSSKTLTHVENVERAGFKWNQISYGAAKLRRLGKVSFFAIFRALNAKYKAQGSWNYVPSLKIKKSQELRERVLRGHFWPQALAALGH